MNPIFALKGAEKPETGLEIPRKCCYNVDIFLEGGESMKHGRNLIKAMFQRVTLVTLSILAQLAVLALGLVRAGEAYRIVSVALTLLSWVLLLYIYGNNCIDFRSIHFLLLGKE